MTSTTTATSTTTPAPENESLVAHVMRSCKNAVTNCFGCIQTSDEFAKIKYKAYQIESRKKTFGVTYLNLIQEKASEESLNACLNAALADVSVFEKDIQVLQAEIDRVNQETRVKIETTKPGVAASAATGTTPAAAVVTATVPTTTTTTPATVVVEPIVPETAKPIAATDATAPVVTSTPLGSHSAGPTPVDATQEVSLEHGPTIAAVGETS